METNISSFILETDTSGHFSVISQFQFSQSIVIPPKSKDIRIYFELPLVDFKNELRHVNCMSVLQSDNIGIY